MCEPAEKRARTTEEQTTKDEVVKISVQKMSGGEPYVLEVQKDSTLADLREAICKAESCRTEIIVLHLNGDVLERSKDSSSLAECNLKDGVTVTLVKVMSTEASFQEEEFVDELEQRCKLLFTNDHDQFKTAWFFHNSRQGRRVSLVGLDGFYFEVASTCNFSVPCGDRGKEMIRGGYRNLYGIGHAGGPEIFLNKSGKGLTPGCFSKSLQLICESSGKKLCPWLESIDFKEWGWTVSEGNDPGEDGELAQMEEATAPSRELQKKLQKNGEKESCSVLDGMVKSLCETIEEEEEGTSGLKEALEKQGYQAKDVLRKWSLAALEAYDRTFPQTDPSKWRDWSWDDFRLPGECDDRQDQDGDSSPENSPAGSDNDAGKGSNADDDDDDVNEDDGEDGADDDNGNSDKEGAADVEG